MDRRAFLGRLAVGAALAAITPSAVSAFQWPEPTGDEQAWQTIPAYVGPDDQIVFGDAYYGASEEKALAKIPKLPAVKGWVLLGHITAKNVEFPKYYDSMRFANA